MPRPIADERMTVRMPSELLDRILKSAARRNCSANAVVLTCLENDLARMATYELDFYTDLIPLLKARQGDNGGRCPAELN